jgi:hypothetical protein
MVQLFASRHPREIGGVVAVATPLMDPLKAARLVPILYIQGDDDEQFSRFETNSLDFAATPHGNGETWGYLDGCRSQICGKDRGGACASHGASVRTKYLSSGTSSPTLATNGLEVSTPTTTRNTGPVGRPIFGIVFSCRQGCRALFGVIPAHLNELSPDAIRSLFPGFVYQLGVLISSPAVSIEYLLRNRLGYPLALTLFESCASWSCCSSSPSARSAFADFRLTNPE